MAQHVAFLDDQALDEIMARRKRLEIRASFRGLACASVREGDLLYPKRVGAGVEAACEVGRVLFYRNVRPDEVARLAREYADATSRAYLRRYAAPRNRNRRVSLAVIELLNLREAALPPEITPRGVRSGWVAHLPGA